ncbi:hypothetical protein TI39_contig354g00124 [Zymoseptoria brevis]|uniref:Ubiquitin-like protease family profile domain-containing protein n=1 Tax=Zymoseptoria brevis TaxID=1047168 RepID=A0A0F4GR82_9PEZI|nr:hypothetical protein TI39_contig354g00124 [Zymoseptoria brevis]
MPGRSYQPRNTLGKPSAQAGTKSANGDSSNSYSPGSANPRARGAATLSTTASSGRNVRQKRDLADHEAAEGMISSSANKRQRLQNGGKGGNMLDLTMDKEDYFGGQILGIQRQDPNGGPPHIKEPRQHKKSGGNDPFSFGESRQNDVDTGLKSKRNQRRMKGRLAEGSQRSRDSVRPESQSSARETSEGTSGFGQNGAAQTLAYEQRQFNNPASSRSPPERDQGIPPIHLSDGLDNAAEEAKQRRMSRQGAPADMRGLPENISNRQHHAILERSTSDAPRLATGFKRDTEGQRVPSRMTASERMRGSVDSLGNRGSSPDTLHGGTTIQNSATRKLSPSKSHTGTKSRTLGKTNPRAGQRPRQSPTQLADDEHDIPIKAIYSMQCVEKAKDLSLVWSLQSQSYLVRNGSNFVRLPSSDEYVAISRKDISQWRTSKNAIKVYINGPKSSCSIGKILIEFFDQNGVSACKDALCSSGSAIAEQTLEHDNFDRMFANVSRMAEEAYEKFCLSARAAQLAMPQNRVARSHSVQSEKIVYDRDSPVPVSAPRRMLDAHGRRHEDPVFSETTSRYFEDTEAPRKSGRVSRAPTSKPKSPTPPPKWTDKNELPAWPSMVYPSQGVRRVTVGREDIKRLDEEEFLNDNLVSFAMRHIEENMDPKHKDKVYCFNTFFYTTLNRKKGKNRLDYQAVERWTKGVDLFSKDYVVVPINAHLHWFVAIICNLPNLERKLAEADEDDGKGRDDQRSRIEPTQTELEITGSRSVPKAVTRVEMDDEQPDFGPDNDDRKSDVYEFDERGNVRSAHQEETLEPCPPTIKKGGKKSRPAPPARKYDVNQPVIITLDSLGAAHSTEIRVLKEYISAEAHGKRGMDVDVSQLSGITAKGIPEQPNYCDCGVFVVGYLKEFAKDPDKFIHKILRKEMKHEDFSDFKAPQTRDEIRRNILELGDEQQRQRLLHKQAKKATKTKASSPDAGSHKPSNLHPASSALPTLEFPPRQATQSSAVVEPPTTPCRSPAQTSPSKPVEADNDHLDFSPPKVLAGPQTRQESRPLPWNDNEDEDMLDHGGMSSALPHAPHSDGSSSTTTNSGSKSSQLDTFKNDIKEAGEAAHRNAVAAAQHERKPTLANDSQEEPEPEIAESQDSHTGQVWQGERTTFRG